MVTFTTEPQPPLTTMEKHDFNFDRMSYFDIKICFVDIYLGRKYATVFLTNQIVGGAYPHIYDDRMKFLIKDNNIRIRNSSPLYNVLKIMLVHDGLIDKMNNNAILIPTYELKKYLTDRVFRVQGRNIWTYQNVTIPGGDS